MDNDEWEIYKMVAVKKPEWTSRCRVCSIYPGCLLQVVKRYTLIPESARKHSGFLEVVWKNCKGCQHYMGEMENSSGVYGEY